MAPDVHEVLRKAGQENAMGKAFHVVRVSCDYCACTDAEPWCGCTGAYSSRRLFNKQRLVFFARAWQLTAVVAALLDY